MVKRTKGFEEMKKTKIHVFLDEGVRKKAREKSLERGDKSRTLYASDFGFCMRRTWYQFFPQEYPVEEADARVLRIFDNGDDVHVRLGGYLKMAPEIDFREEIDVPRDELEVHGRCDGICTVDARATVVEFKSINKKVMTEPKEEHVGQLMWYLSMWRRLRKELNEDFGFEEGDVLTEADVVGESASGLMLQDLDGIQRWLLFTQGEIQGEIVYESKPTQDFFTFPIEYDPEQEAKVRQWFVALKWFIENRHRPPVKYDGGKYPCSWGQGSAYAQCPFFKYCYGDGS